MENKKMVPEIRFSGFTDPWEQCELGEILKYEQPQAYIVDSTYYDDTYNTPVLTAGQSFILGYTNEIFGIKDASEDNPVIIFDDFTTSSHYVDFPFKIKSSAMKLLSLNNSDDDINCVFNAMQNISYVPVTHERHWISTFAKFNVLLPENKDEQKKIGIFFASIDNLITLHQRKLEKLKTFKKAMLDKMFPKNGELVPEIRFSGFTDPWEQHKLGDIGTITTGSTPSTSIPDYYSDDGIIWVTPTDIIENITFESARKLSELGQQVGRVVPKNTILITCIASIGKNTMLVNTGSFNQQINGLTPNENKYEPYFLLTESELWSAQMKKSAAAGTMQIINRTEFSGLETWIPTLNEQKVIGTYFRSLDNLITLHQRKLEKLQNIKKSMLNKMFI